jgi:hypothetical protein
MSDSTQWRQREFTARRQDGSAVTLIATVQMQTIHFTDWREFMVPTFVEVETEQGNRVVPDDAGTFWVHPSQVRLPRDSDPLEVSRLLEPFPVMCQELHDAVAMLKPHQLEPLA